MKRTLALALTLMVGCALSLPAQAKTEIKIATVAPTGSAWMRIFKKMKAKLDALHQPNSPTQAQDAQGILKKIVDAAKIQKTRQQVAEVPADI